ncbi:uncharacterized protein CCOS01_01062 [Colletotrichum costaricense]|uniref:Uncharacterized protein n=1 Tax=Colletotrichum costaricense TaxID=1209916 RepID=A0AAJ0E8L3_9PEZI|nr:uncharacterized protein CCOS01_01062 [Colletotrichum costaricense]KAK1539748.1 hypothetical protein CCOS01_01062 [Colletotrichum costaricense]
MKALSLQVIWTTMGAASKLRLAGPIAQLPKYFSGSCNNPDQARPVESAEACKTLLQAPNEPQISLHLPVECRRGERI